VIALKELLFADSADNTPDSREVAIARELWRWRSLPEAERAEITSTRSRLSVDVDCYLARAFSFKNSASSRNWSTDGVLELSISQTAPTSFLIVGAAIWLDHSIEFYVAPFELEFNFAAPNEIEPERCIIRFGVEEPSGNIRRIPYDRMAARVVFKRPKRNQDWAFAIELS
jgi:hypothetical protein